MEHEPNTIEAQASRWVARIDAGPLSPEEQAELDAWTSNDRRHHGALIRARAAWLDADRLAALAGGTVPATSKPSTSTLPVVLEKIQARVTFNARRFALAAGIATVAVALGVAWYANQYGGRTYTSEVGEVRNVRLPDGSELTLNTDTRATVRFQEAQREIGLEKGEALFKVAHDAARPFVVHANDVQIKAIGTAFVVRVDDERVDVIVTEGIVDVSRDGIGAQRIAANHRAVVATGSSRLNIEPIDLGGVARHLAWRQGMVAFAGEPLSVAIEEVNRHSRVPIYVDDPKLAAQPVVGIFHANDTEAFARAAAATFGARIVRTDTAIRLVSPDREAQ